MDDDFINYLITDPKYYTNDTTLFKKNLEKTLKTNNINMACFRDKESENFLQLAEVFVDTCKKYNIEKVLLNSDIELASKLNADGVHLTSAQFDKIKEAKSLDLFTVISCHNYNELDLALKLHANTVTYSPIFFTPDKGEPKGISNLKETIKLYEDLHIIALGGIISDEQIEEIKKTNAAGFASIRYFI